MNFINKFNTPHPTPHTQHPSPPPEVHRLRQQLRSGQQSLADWTGGCRAISAVPGAGKSYSLSVAAAIAMGRFQLNPRQQLMVVTYTRSAAASIKDKIKQQLQALHLPPTGFMVQTLHGLALHIAHRHPAQSGLDFDRLSVVTPTQNHTLLRTAVEQWIRHQGDRYRTLLEGRQFDGEETERLRRQSVLRTEVLPQLAATLISEAKSSGLSPQAVWNLSQQSRDPYHTLEVAAGLYEQYDRLLRSRNFIDYDDMILAALRVLDSPGLRQIWQAQIFAVFEDEAQDSSPLQEQLITRLACDPDFPDRPPNLIRVGDPNQAINSTFTPADPLYFNAFCEQCAQGNQLTTLDQAGRSHPIIIAAANFVLEWVNQRWQEQHPHRPLSEAPFRPQGIRPVDRGDRQPNPEAEGKGLEIYTPEDIYQSAAWIGKRAMALLSQNRDRNAAILVRENRQGQFLSQQLGATFKAQGIALYNVSEAERFSQIPVEIFKILQFIDRPHSPDGLKAALEVLEQRGLIVAQDFNALSTEPEEFLYPRALTPTVPVAAIAARSLCRQLLRAKRELPSHQLIPFLGMALQYDGSALATLQKLSERIALEIQGKSSLGAILEALQEMIRAERFEGIEETSDDQYLRPGQLTIITMHKAKGLDWDYVFIPFLHGDLIPGKPWVPTAAQFLGDFTLAEIARVQLRTAVHHRYLTRDRPLVLPDPATAWQRADQLKQAEEYRLLYVALTRAKRLLWLAAEQQAPFRWNLFPGDRAYALQKKLPCPALSALMQQFPTQVISPQ